MNGKSELQPEVHSTSETVEVDISQISSVVIARLVKEVQNEETSSLHPYDRVHNRHNRGR